ncbi:MAG: hypothetical protein ACQETE_15175 [Bacteroidota bacterium]
MIYFAQNKFGNSVAINLKRYILHPERDGWIATFLPKQEIEIMKDLNLSLLSDEDWMALVWWSVNHCVLSQRLYKDDRFLIINYDDLVTKPKDTLNKVMAHVSLPEKGLDKYLRSGRRGKGSGIILNDEIELLCDKLLSELVELR